MSLCTLSALPVCSHPHLYCLCNHAHLVFSCSSPSHCKDLILTSCLLTTRFVISKQQPRFWHEVIQIFESLFLPEITLLRFVLCLHSAQFSTCQPASHTKPEPCQRLSNLGLRLHPSHPIPSSFNIGIIDRLFTCLSCVCPLGPFYRKPDIFLSLNTLNSVYLTLNIVENDCSNVSMSALVF